MKLNLISERMRIYRKMLINLSGILMGLRTNKRLAFKSKKIGFVLSSRRLERVHTVFFYFFIENEYSIFLKRNLGHLASFINFGKYLPSILHLNIVSNIPDEIEWSIFDTEKEASKWLLENRNRRKSNFIEVHCLEQGKNGYLVLKDDSLIMPYPMHPDIYRLGIDKNISELRTQERKFKIFFSGNIDNDYYDERHLNNLFNVMSRVEIIDILKSKLADDNLIETLDAYDYVYSKEYVNKLILNIWDGGNKLDVKMIKVVDWLLALSKTDFFLFCPGVTVPQCHNQIEAMSVGAIPITEFPHMFSPALQHGVNCIVFKGKEDLLDKVNFVLSMDQVEVTRMRNNVIDYYDNYCHPISFVNRADMETKMGECKKLYVISDYAFEKFL